MTKEPVTEQTILFLHGIASYGRSTKAKYLRERFRAIPQIDFHTIDFNPTPADFEYMTTTGLIDRLRQFVLDRDLGAFSIIGSSYGGLIGLHYAQRFGGVDRMLLLAPGLAWLSGGLSEEQLEQWRATNAVALYHPGFERELAVRYDMQVDGLRYLERIAPPTPILIIHGRQDMTVPLDHSRIYAAQFPEQVRLVEVDADHDLNDHLGFIWDYVQSYLLHSTARR